MRTVLILGFLLPFINSPLDEEINFNPRVLGRDLATLCGGREYSVSEFDILQDKSSHNQPTGKFFTVDCKGDEIATLWIGRVNCCRSGGCSKEAATSLATEYEYFDYYIIFNPDKSIAAVRVFDYRATRGEEISSAKWLKQFSGYTGKKELRLGKEIDSISGATVSAASITEDIRKRTECLSEMKLQH